MIKIRERTIAFRIAKRSFGLESKIKLIADFMSYEHEWSNEDHLDPVKMKGYHYIVTGEDETELEPKPPLYLVPLKKDSHKVVTTQMVWECDGELLINDDSDGKLKDLCLSFALFKLLRRRFAGYPLHECQQQKTWRFVHDGLLYDLSGNESYERAFRVIKVELAFLFDFLYTKYHVIFTASIPKRKIIEFLVIIVCCGMVAFELNGYHAPIGSINLGDVDVLLTCLVVIAILMLELFEWVTIVFSDWMKVLLISKYVKKQSWRQNRPLKKIIEFICRRKLLKRWEKKMGQYSLLQSYDYNPPRWLYMVDLITLGSIDLPKEGQREDTPVKVAKQVKKAILQLLKTNNGGGFSNGSSSLVRNERRDLLWACHLETHTHTILVWHIATSICENQWNFGDAIDILVATTLSKYCAYLVAFVPALLPNHAYATESIFDAVVDEARIMLKGWKSLEERCDELMGRHETEMGNRVGDERPETIMRRGIRVWKRLLGIREDEQQPGPDTVIAKGAKLAKQLLETRLHFKWKILADFWVELMLFIAPSDNAEAHVENLANGGEFITHLWALLSHAGIIDRSTSPQYAHP
ncbi:uncharacterized protein LOC131221438 isoform X2 [Magnolia sinica]|nr:uncharacterized protein LOC131221438 isoform X2 [Magnolia sinica]XP_058072675.1 uncharacterized protein LOC131221438 isoform X2 [Magnolia sinica]